MNPPFGPFHHPELQPSVDHAERIAAIVSRLHAAPHDDAAAAWLEGRASEIEAVVSLVARGCALEEESPARAAQRLDVYIETLHVGLALHFPRVARACCGIEYATTEVDPTTIDVDPSELLAGFPGSTTGT